MTRMIYGHRAEGFGEHHAMANETETGHKNAQSHESNYNRFENAGYTPRQIERGKLTLQRAEQWRRDNPEAWAYIVTRACEYAKEGRPFTMQGLIESVRSKAFVDRHGNDTKTNNDFAAVFARWLMIEYPQTRGLIECRRSVFDSLVVCDG